MAARALQPVPVVQHLVAVAGVVADPPVVHVGVEARLDAPDLPLVVVQLDVLAAGVHGRDAGRLLQQPHPLLEQEVLVQQRPDRAQVDHVPGQLVVQRPAREDVDLLGAAAPVDVQLAGAAHLTGEPHAPGTHDAPVVVEQHVEADVLLRLLDLVLLEAALGPAVLVAVVLQVALAGLVAHGAVQRVVDQQVLHHLLLVRDRLAALGVDDHAVAHRRLAGRHQLGDALDLDQADAAGGDDGEPRVVAVLRDRHRRVVARLQHHLALLGLDRLAVHGDLGHGGGW
jgi:hypothetical protein